MMSYPTYDQIPLRVLHSLATDDHIVDTPDAAYQWCRTLATSHYENFPVASLLLPTSIRVHLWAVYAFARVADDVADEAWTDAPQQRMAALNALETLVLRAAEQPIQQGSAIEVALSQTIASKRLSPAPFLDLLRAFRHDVEFHQPASWDALLGYCALSANPVGRIVLDVAGVKDAAAIAASDKVCTALQLINFWQDLSVDRLRGRTYLPSDMIEEHGLSGALIVAFQRTTDEFAAGIALPNHIPMLRLRMELRAIIHGGLRMLERSMEYADNCFDTRPKLNTKDAAVVLWRAVTSPGTLPLLRQS